VQGFGQGSVGDAAVGAKKKVWRNSGNGHCGGQKRGTTGEGEGEHVSFEVLSRVVGRFIRQLIRSEALCFEK
jgi:hypothetical protein